MRVASYIAKHGTKKISEIRRATVIKYFICDISDIRIIENLQELPTETPHIKIVKNTK